MSKKLKSALTGLLLFASAALLGYYGLRWYNNRLMLNRHDSQQAAMLLEQRTENDIVVDNAQLILQAMYDYARDHDWVYSRSLEELVDEHYLSSIPVNPFTGQPTELIRVGDMPNAGNLSIVFGESGARDDSGNIVERNDATWLIGYGDPALGFNLHPRHVAGQEWDEPSIEEALRRTIIFLDGDLLVTSVRRMDGNHYWRDSLETVLRKNGYTLPIKMDAGEAAGK
ncbi:MAG: hypothetical protein H7A35_11710 [Planctomycetales bacterium]|nr:hypothetical protein [bacterium]UNM07525.1 MAG: hypothetical protein H7A35_11710 [Planctomycetales bacterium]